MGSEEILDPICWRQRRGVFLLAPGNPHALKWGLASLLILGKRPRASVSPIAAATPLPLR